MKQNAVTIYVVKKNKVYVPKALMRFLFDAYPDLICDYNFLYMRTYVDNREDWVAGQRSRIGDAIAVFAGADLLRKIAKYSEDHIFHLSKRLRITIKGGQRNSDVSNDAAAGFGPNTPFAQQLIKDLSSEAATQASRTASPSDNP